MMAVTVPRVRQLRLELGGKVCHTANLNVQPGAMSCEFPPPSSPPPLMDHGGNIATGRRGWMEMLWKHPVTLESILTRVYQSVESAGTSTTIALMWLEVRGDARSGEPQKEMEG